MYRADTTDDFDFIRPIIFQPSNSYSMYDEDEDDDYCEECGKEIENCYCHDGDGTIWQCPKAMENGGKCPDNDREECTHEQPHEFIVGECFMNSDDPCPMCQQITEAFLSKEDMEI
jgi:hypothetical protein